VNVLSFQNKQKIKQKQKPGGLTKSFQDFKGISSSELEVVMTTTEEMKRILGEVAPRTVVSTGISWEASPCKKDGCVTLKALRVNTQMLFGVL